MKGNTGVGMKVNKTTIFRPPWCPTGPSKKTKQKFEKERSHPRINMRRIINVKKLWKRCIKYQISQDEHNIHLSCVLCLFLLSSAWGASGGTSMVGCLVMPTHALRNSISVRKKGCFRDKYGLQHHASTTPHSPNVSSTFSDTICPLPVSVVNQMLIHEICAGLFLHYEHDAAGCSATSSFTVFKHREPNTYWLSQDNLLPLLLCVNPPKT